ncbi:MAG: MBL fold metallo-hydrolase [Holdemanella sp.]|nr:MBL fold metallo-hydrolase [Holdemanella sp.]
MKIQWLGHSCFKILSDTTSVIFDPFQDGSIPGIRNIREKANCILCSHEHFDHNARETVELINKELDCKVFEIPSYHDDVKGAKRGLNTIHVLDYDGFRICHLGDLGCALNEEQINLLMNVDVLFIPVGGFFTINAIQAKAIVDTIKPVITIPMHYRSDTFGFDAISTVDAFTSLFNDVEYCDSIMDLDMPHKPVVVLNYD